MCGKTGASRYRIKLAAYNYKRAKRLTRFLPKSIGGEDEMNGGEHGVEREGVQIASQVV